MEFYHTYRNFLGYRDGNDKTEPSIDRGALIGLDRGLKGRSAGIKTHALVCIGSALVMMTSQYMNIYFQTDSDLSRMGAQVISGVGFLGVGTNYGN